MDKNYTATSPYFFFQGFVFFWAVLPGLTQGKWWLVGRYLGLLGLRALAGSSFASSRVGCGGLSDGDGCKLYKMGGGAGDKWR